MFLDDELLEMCESALCDTPEEIQQLYSDVLSKCQEYYISRIFAGMNKNQAKKIFDKAFNLYDSFVRLALKSTDKKVQILGEMFEKHSFKSEFMSNYKMRAFYESL